MASSRPTWTTLLLHLTELQSQISELSSSYTLSSSHTLSLSSAASIGSSLPPAPAARILTYRDRIPEMASGWGSDIMQNEATFMVFDGAMILIAVLLLTSTRFGSSRFLASNPLASFRQRRNQRMAPPRQSSNGTKCDQWKQMLDEHTWTTCQRVI